MGLASKREVEEKGIYYDLHCNRADFDLGGFRDYVTVGQTFISRGKLFVIMDIDILNGRLIVEECSREAIESFF